MRRTALLDATVDAVRRHGPDASMDDIAAEAGITKPILYRHFDGRVGLVAAVAERVLESIVAELRDALNRPVEVEEVVATAIDVWVAFVEREPALYRFLVSSEAVVGRIGGEVTAVVEDYLRAGGRDTDAAAPWAFGIVGMVHMAAAWWSEASSLPRRQLVGYLTDLLWNGLSTEGRSS